MRTLLRGPVAAIIALACAVLAGAACTGDGGGKQAVFADTECADCISTECSAELSSCEAIGDCDDALACTLDCPEEDNALDVDCVETRCADLVTTSAGATAFNAVVGCYLEESPASGTCGSQCAPPSE